MLSLQDKNSMLGRVQWMLVGAAALICGAFGVFAYRPMSNQLAALNGKIEWQRRELASCRNETSTLGSVKSDVDRLRAKLKEYKVDSGNQALGQFSIQISAIAKKNSLKNPKSHWGEAPVKRDRLIESPVQLEFDGDFTNVYSFLRQVEELPQLTRVPKIHMTSSKEMNGQVKVQMTMNLYTTADAN